jgi:hypothetical protein
MEEECPGGGFVEDGAGGGGGGEELAELAGLLGPAADTFSSGEALII